MKITIDVPDEAIISCLNNAFSAGSWFHGVKGLPPFGAKTLKPFRVKADDPKTEGARWYDVSLEDVARGVALFIVRESHDSKRAREKDATVDPSYVSGGWGNSVSELVEGSLDTAASDLLLQFMVWGEEVYA